VLGSSGADIDADEFIDAILAQLGVDTPAAVTGRLEAADPTPNVPMSAHPYVGTWPRS